jgi:crotonobetainyl-CoA:carnitine CoA-transferase CaiB-like acyl-CoA transferase
LLGQHTDEVLSQLLQLDAQQLADLRQQKVI